MAPTAHAASHAQVSARRSCADCGSSAGLEVPLCDDAHDDCPELVCVGCGAAYVAGFGDVAVGGSGTVLRTRGGGAARRDRAA